MKISILTVGLIMLLTSCANSQTKPQADYQLVDPCEGCEGVFEYDNKKLSAVDTLPDFNKKGTNIKISGTIFLPDGKTPAKNIVMYLYHTDKDGLYSRKGNETGWGKRHGYNRGWLKTGEDGKYTFYTIIPGTYPNGSDPAHIHPTILEPNGKYYWIDDFLFEGDPLITSAKMNDPTPRGGDNGVLKLVLENGILTGHRNLVLGKNIPGYK